MVKTLLVSTANSDADDSITGYGTFGMAHMSPFFEPSSGASEASREIVCRAAGTLSDFEMDVVSNGRSTSSSQTVRKNGANTSITVSIGAGTTGNLKDASNTASISAGDTFCYSRIHGSGGGTLDIQCTTLTLDTTGDPVTHTTTSSKQLTSFNNASVYSPIAGATYDRTTESDVEIPMSVAGSISNLHCGINANARTSTTTFVSRINGATGNQTISVGSGATGGFEDTTNSDTVSASDLVNVMFTTGAGSSETLDTQTTGLVFTPTDTSGFAFFAHGFYSASSTEFFHIAGDCDDHPSESTRDFYASFDFTWSDFTVNVTSNAATSTTTVRSRINAANGNQSVAYTSGQTGVKTDSSNTDSVVDGDALSGQATGMNGVFAFKGVSSFATPPSTGHDLLAEDVESASEVSTPAIGQVHAITADDVEAASEISVPAVGQEHALTATSVESASEVTSPAVGQEHALTAASIESASEVSIPAVGQEHGLTATSVQSTSELTVPDIGQIHALAATSIESASEVTAPALAEVAENVDALLAEDIESAAEVTSPTIGQIHTLTAEDVESLSEVSYPFLNRPTGGVSTRNHISMSISI